MGNDIFAKEAMVEMLNLMKAIRETQKEQSEKLEVIKKKLSGKKGVQK